MKGFMMGVVVAVACIAVLTYVYFAKGYAPVATNAPAMPFEKRLARMALHARLAKEMPTTVPIEASEAHYLAGAQAYLEHCAVCHGLPGKPETAIARGEFPRPPQLFKGKGVTDDPPGETYWKTANGIRLTGMPGFQASLPEVRIWELALLLANADKLPDSATAVLNAQPAPAAPPAAAAAE
jgi:thiosulfate dehydrogenase